MLRIGTCGFQYDDWYGPFYPPGLKRNEALVAYAECFSALEIDVTYYRTPPMATALRMADILKDRVACAVKIPGAVTHQRKIEAETLDPFFQFLRPLRDARCLAALLVQFPAGFSATKWNLAYLKQVLAALPPDDIVVEFRSPEWEASGLLEEVRGIGCSIAVVDQPEHPTLSTSAQPWEPRDRIQYLRFHGRNGAGWYAGTTQERYNYLYSKEELAQWAERLRPTLTSATTTLAFFNNHAHGAAPENARMLQELLGIDSRMPRRAEMDLFG